jgi:hypothetical protein
VTHRHRIFERNGFCVRLSPAENIGKMNGREAVYIFN